MSETKYIREYIAIYHSDDNNVHVSVYGAYDNLETYSNIPSMSELEALFSASGFEIDISDCFQNCASMIASPKLPDAVYDNSSYLYGLGETFSGCTSLKIPPKLPPAQYSYYSFDGCSELRQAPVIQKTAKYLNYMFRNCSKLAAPVSIPKGVSAISYMFDGCTVMAGEMIIRPTSISSVNTLRNTTGAITLYGDQAVCEAIAATANNGNASWSAWYSPVAAVTDRGPGSYTTATDMTRMVRNGALAVDTYAPGRMAYQQGDIVREDEWIALVEAAQTIDPSVTLSTHYTNLNKIEAAFDSAL